VGVEEEQPDIIMIVRLPVQLPVAPELQDRDIAEETRVTHIIQEVVGEQAVLVLVVIPAQMVVPVFNVPLPEQIITGEVVEEALVIALTVVTEVWEAVAVEHPGMGTLVTQVAVALLPERMVLAVVMQQAEMVVHIQVVAVVRAHIIIQVIKEVMAVQG
jgi:hypothetical protein